MILTTKHTKSTKEENIFLKIRCPLSSSIFVSFGIFVGENSRGGTMKTRAAVAWEASKPLSIEEVEVEGPKNGEVLLQVKATGVCHTDAYTLSGKDPEGIFPAIMGHEG